MEYIQGDMIDEALESFLQCEHGIFVTNMEDIAGKIVKKYLPELGEFVFDLEDYVNQVVAENRVYPFDLTTVFTKACNQYLMDMLAERFSWLLICYAERMAIKIGASLNGCLVQEMAKQISVEHSFEDWKKSIQAII